MTQHFLTFVSDLRLLCLLCHNIYLFLLTNLSLNMLNIDNSLGIDCISCLVLVSEVMLLKFIGRLL